MIFQKYDSNKESGLEWLGDIPSEWRVKRIKDVAFLRYSNVDKKSYDNQENIFLCNYTDVYKNELVTKKIDFMKATASKEEIKKFIIKKDDVLFTKDSESFDDNANPCLVYENFTNVVCGYHLAQIRANKKDLIGIYLFRLLQSVKYNYHFAVNSKGITRVGLGIKAVNDAKLFLPPLKIQTKIATYLDKQTKKIDREIELLEQKTVKYKELKKTLINETVLRGLEKNVELKDSGIEWIGDIPEHWESTRFKQVLYKKKKKFNEKLNCGSISFGNVVFKDNSKVPKETKASYQEVCIGEFLINPLNLNFDLKSLRTAYSLLNVVVSSGYIVLKARENINKNFLRWILHQFDISQMKTLSAGVRHTIHYDDIGNTFFYMPPLKEQVKIATYLDEKTTKIDKITKSITRKIELLKEFRKTLINDSVTGKIKVA